MKKGKYAQPQKFGGMLYVLLILLLLIAAAEGVILLLPRLHAAEITLPGSAQHQKVDGVELPGSSQYLEAAEKNKDSISIPGYEALHLKADSLQQELAFPNPSANTCYFKISLCLEDGTVLWRSDLVKPGEHTSAVKLEKELEAGTYPNAMLRYDCFAMDKNHTPLNGAVTKLTLFAEER